MRWRDCLPMSDLRLEWVLSSWTTVSLVSTSWKLRMKGINWHLHHMVPWMAGKVHRREWGVWGLWKLFCSRHLILAGCSVVLLP